MCDDSEIDLMIKQAIKFNMGLELQAFHKPFLCEDVREVERYKKLIKPINTLSLHAPFGDLCPGSSDPMVRDVAMNRFNLGYSVAEELGIKNIVFHIGWIPGAGSPTNWTRRCVNFWRDFLKDKDPNTSFFIENLFDNTMEIIKNVILGVADNRVRICLDIGHVNCYSKINLIEWIKCLGNLIGYIHLHDNNGYEDQHLGIGMGNIPMKDSLLEIERVSYDAIWALEMYPEYINKSIEWLKKEDFIN